jgi:alpha-tubulin suppressor-like RCC1 family protein
MPSPWAAGSRRTAITLLGILASVAAAAPIPTTAAVPAAPVVTAMSAVFKHTCARTSDGSVWCWGLNSHGQLGDGTTSWRARPVQVTRGDSTPLAGVTAISTGDWFTCARTSGGAAWCWGYNDFGGLGDGTVEHDRYHPVRVMQHDGSPLAGVTAIATGDVHTCARTSGGAAWCWGYNYYGQLGDGTRTDRRRAVRVTGTDGNPFAGVTAIAAGGDHTCALTRDGTAWCWGENSGGQLGDGTTTHRRHSVQVVNADGSPFRGVTAISVGIDDTCAVTSDGAAWCWGGNWDGQLGDGTTTDRRHPVQVTKRDGSALTGVVAMSAGYEQTCAVTSGGVAWCWAANHYGQLGDGTMTDRLHPIRVTRSDGSPLTAATAITAGLKHSCAVTSRGVAWCWGGNFYGQLGDGTQVRRLRAVRVIASWATP